jgi:hypothetical protein
MKKSCEETLREPCKEMRCNILSRPVVLRAMICVGGARAAIASPREIA